MLLNAATGALRTTSSKGDERHPMLWELPGTIRSIGAKGKAVKRSNWVDVTSLRDGKPREQVFAHSALRYNE